jgi:hypothetical protein
MKENKTKNQNEVPALKILSEMQIGDKKFPPKHN